MSGTRRKPGRMGSHVDGFEVRLLALGYTPGTVRNMLKVVGQLGRWMAIEDVEVAELDAVAIERFLGVRRAQGTRRVPGVRALAPLLDFLTSEGVLISVPTPATPVEELMADYRSWLVVDRGLAAATVLRYERLARRFLEERADSTTGRCRGR